MMKRSQKVIFVVVDFFQELSMSQVKQEAGLWIFILLLRVVLIHVFGLVD